MAQLEPPRYRKNIATPSWGGFVGTLALKVIVKMLLVTEYEVGGHMTTSRYAV